MSDIKLKKIRLSKGGRRVDYYLSLSSKAKRYIFSHRRLWFEFQESVADCPEAILAIPALANLVPIAWFAELDFEGWQVDDTFAEALKEIRQQSERQHGRILHAAESALLPVSVQPHESVGNLLLFSGGLDSVTSLVRHQGSPLVFGMIHGADVPYYETQRWDVCRRMTLDQPVFSKNQAITLATNFREFYSCKVDELVGGGWWGKVQHGLALTSAFAPACWKHALGCLLIGSSDTEVAWGSTPECDQAIRWTGTQVINDGSELSRFEKTRLVASAFPAQAPSPALRICYSDVRGGANCGTCEKCVRTAISLALLGEDPTRFSLPIPTRPFSTAIRNFADGSFASNQITLRFWRQIEEGARTALETSVKVPIETYYDLDGLHRIAAGDVTQIIKERVTKQSAATATWRSRLALRCERQFPRLFRHYVKIRRLF